MLAFTNFFFHKATCSLSRTFHLAPISNFLLFQIFTNKKSQQKQSNAKGSFLHRVESFIICNMVLVY